MSKYDDLRIIKELKQDGDMTQEEFEIEKQKILSRTEEIVQKGWGLYAMRAISGICSIVFALIGLVSGNLLYISIIFGIIAMVLGIVSKKRLKDNNDKSKMAITGLITGILGTLISILIIIMVVYSMVKIYNTNRDIDSKKVAENNISYYAN